MPAVYAWYRMLDFSEAAKSGDALIAHIDSLLAAALSDRFDATLGYLYELTVTERAKPLSSRSRGYLESIAYDDDARHQLVKILSTTTELQSPLYVGKASKLKKRIDDHVSGSSGLIERFESAGIKIKDCVLFYRYFDKSEISGLRTCLSGDEFEEDDDIVGDKVAILVEELLTRLSPSSFVRRPG